LVVHAWDLAQGIGADDQLDPDLAAALWQRLSIEGTGFDLEAGYFAPPRNAVAAGSRQDNLLGLVGRTPNWRKRGA
jgi:hypothetical protein